MKTRSGDQDRTAGVGSVKRPSPGFWAMGETRRLPTFLSSPWNGDPKQIFLSGEGFKQRTEELEKSLPQADWRSGVNRAW
jgi:hypothetical protein